ncbi:RHS repeat domain-containing protein [Pseudomonas sp. CGJS7]|uniref:RHS repeat domain-containing protein n=1 Tax=Pseudomonas sp. CGJS7 TaxID=3109348 RepID=UPI00300A35F0
MLEKAINLGRAMNYFAGSAGGFYFKKGRGAVLNRIQRCGLAVLALSVLLPPYMVAQAQTKPMLGVRTEYDALGRTTSVKRDSELGLLTTSMEYRNGFLVLTKDARNNETLTGYQAFGEPTYDKPTGINSPEGTYTEIYRDVFGKPTALRRRNSDASVSLYRFFVYDSNARLCKTIEPETGATVNDYDAAGNIAWTASGLALNDRGDCNRSVAYSSGRRVDRAYDDRNRLSSLSFPDGRGNQVWSYYSDGLPREVTTSNEGAGQGLIVNGYSYNKRRLLSSESLTHPGWTSWNLGYAYDGNGSLRSLTYPTLLTVDYAPNGLGQPTQITSAAQTFASNIRYYPNGAVAGFTYGNGRVHSMAQNARQLPRQVDNGAINYVYDYDGNGNPTRVRDVNSVQGAYSGDRDLHYDGLDRLTMADLYWHRTETYTYDALDNIKKRRDYWTGAVQDYWYDGSNRLTNIRDGQGASITGLGYDVQGNLQDKNGQGYVFDYGNRLRQVTGKETYRYDAYGRRTASIRAGDSQTLPMYSQSGQMLYRLIYDEKRIKPSRGMEHIYLGNSLIATREQDWTGAPIQTRFQHADALGSPVAETDTAGQIVSKTQWEAWGQAIGKPAYEGVGYTGHVMDGGTALVYMQQRYYDPAIGRFLSVDPVTADSGSGTNFNRYWYANNNPYTFTDPDGREVRYVLKGGATVVDQVQTMAHVSFSKSASIEFSRISQSKAMYTIEFTKGEEPRYDRDTRTVVINPQSGLIIKSSGKIQSPALGGIHEISHAAQHDRIGSAAMEKSLEAPVTVEDRPGGGIIAKYKASAEEERATRVESRAARELGESARRSYGDSDGSVRTCGPTSVNRC